MVYMFATFFLCKYRDIFTSGYQTGKVIVPAQARCRCINPALLCQLIQLFYFTFPCLSIAAVSHMEAGKRTEILRPGFLAPAEWR